MPFRPSFVLALLAPALAAAPALSQSQSTASTVRIEPRPYYGAVVTLEKNVRVWRPLPPTSHVIINPDNRTPLYLSLEKRDYANLPMAPDMNGAGAGAPYPYSYPVPDYYGYGDTYGPYFTGRNFHGNRFNRGLPPFRGHHRGGHGGRR